MEVTLSNFEQLLPQIEASIDRCDFMAIDCELSGLNVSDDKDNCFETVEDRYLNVRNSASEFLVLQFGLCPFFYNTEKDEYTHEGYSFFTFPRQLDGRGPNVRFLCEASSLEFLAGSGGFDFNKLIYQGIPYLTYSDEEKMKEDLEKRYVQHSTENSQPVNVPENYKRFLDNTESKIQRFLTSSLNEMTLDGVSAYQRRLIYNNVKPKYDTKLYFESIQKNVDEDEDDTSSANPAVESNSTGENGKIQPARAASKVRVLRVYKLNKAEQQARDNEKKRKEIESISMHVGFSKVIRKICETGKVVVGHNMLLDVCHTIHQFVDKLPDNLAEFKQMVQNTFPNLIDTKYMAISHPFRDLINSTVLRDLLMKFMESPFNLPQIKSMGPDKGYTVNDIKSHEAGYDAFMTGCCFIAMCQHLGSLHNPKKHRVLANSPLVMPFLNKLYMMRMSDIPYLNISGTDLTPSRSHVFYVTCPKDAQLKNIQQIFNQFGNIQTWWRNQTSLFVALCDKDQSSLVMDNIECSSEYRVFPFGTYQKMQKEEKKRPLMSESPERVGETFKKLVAGCEKSPPGEHKKKRPKTEAEKIQVKQVFEEPTSWN